MKIDEPTLVAPGLLAVVTSLIVRLSSHEEGYR
jgi:hypothetical protein